MNITMKVTGVQAAVLRLRNIEKRVHENARKTMHRAADRIVATAKKMAPVDEHNLEDAIVKQVGYEGDRRRLAIDVVVLPSVNGVRVEDYAAYMHNGEYNLGEKSQAKQAGQNEVVGPGFIDRAADREQERLRRVMVAAVEEEVSR